MKHIPKHPSASTVLLTKSAPKQHCSNFLRVRDRNPKTQAKDGVTHSTVFNKQPTNNILTYRSLNYYIPNYGRITQQTLNFIIATCLLIRGCLNNIVVFLSVRTHYRVKLKA
ncbi:hypothetical protein HanPI659440_Chr17g0682751 [Helianthus annuus]|nr:hypothetical protein HanPI659440_Chr17g0682751 [Helianthus annuus]